MAQLKKTCTVTNGSQTVTLPGDYTKQIKQGTIFLVAGELVPYTVSADATFGATAGVTTVVLSGAYQGATNTAAAGVFAVDFTYPGKIPTMAQGDVGTGAIFTQAMYKIQSILNAGLLVPLQPDWTQADSTKLDFIKNKPTIPTITPQIQANWTQTDTSKLDYVRNKPIIPAAQVQSDWSQTDAASLSFIKNKPTIPTSSTQLQADWNQTVATATDYIKNKPAALPATAVSAGNESTIASGYASTGGILYVNYRGATAAIKQVRFYDGMMTGSLAAVVGSNITASGDVSGKSTGLNTTLTIASGGTGAVTAAAALAALGGIDSPGATAILNNYGIGMIGAAPSIANIDDMTVLSGMYYVGSSTTGTFPPGTAPSNGWAGWLMHKVYATAGFQMLQPYGADRLFFRRAMGSTWQAWQELALKSGGTGGTSGLPTTGGTLTGPLTFSGAAPVWYFDETDQTGATGKWRVIADGGNVRFDLNLATARDFSTYKTALALTGAGALVIPNNTAIYGQDSGGVARGMLFYSADNFVNLYNGTAGATRIFNSAGTTVKWTHDDNGTTTQSGNVNAVGMSLTGQALFAEGSATAPGISFQNDGAPDTGLYHIGDGVFGVTCNTNPTVKFSSVDGTTFLNRARANTSMCIGPNNLAIYESATNRLCFRAGASGSDKLFQFWESGDFTGPGTGNITGFLGVYVNSATPSVGFTASGNGPTPSKTIRVNGSSGNMEWINSAYSAAIASLTDSGTFSANVITQTSDERKKTNWRPVASGFLQDFAQIDKVGMFDWIEDGETSLGIGAQSLEAILPAAVHSSDDGKSVNAGSASLVIVHELTRLVLKLEARIAALEAKQ